MQRTLTGCVLSLLCACSLTVTIAASAPQIKSESDATSVTKLYDYQPLQGIRRGSITTDALICTVNERVYDTSGTVYRLKDSTPLHDSELFSADTTVHSGAAMVRSIKPISDPAKQNRSAFRIVLSKDYSGQQEQITFSTTYTAKEDTTLTVVPSRSTSNHTQELEIKKGTAFTVNSSLILNENTTCVTNFTKNHCKSIK